MPYVGLNCLDVKVQLGITSDGVHWIDPDRHGTDYKPFEVFCSEMASATPKEYLELQRVSAPADTATWNYSTFATGAVHGQWTCDCGVDTTVYSKVRIDPQTLIVQTNDATFAQYSNSTNVTCLQNGSGCPGLRSYALAGSCVTNYDASGRANIDLIGMPFHLAGTGTEMFTPSGFTPGGTATIDVARKAADLTGGGDCGDFGAQAGLPLAQD